MKIPNLRLKRILKKVKRHAYKKGCKDQGKECQESFNQQKYDLQLSKINMRNDFKKQIKELRRSKRKDIAALKREKTMIEKKYKEDYQKKSKCLNSAYNRQGKNLNVRRFKVIRESELIKKYFNKLNAISEEMINNHLEDKETTKEAHKLFAKKIVNQDAIINTNIKLKKIGRELSRLGFLESEPDIVTKKKEGN